MRSHFALALALAACGDKVTYHVVEFPGFALDVPTEMTYGGDPKVEYRAGQVQAQAGHRVFVVGWQPGANATVDEMPMFMKAMAGALPASAEFRPGAPETLTIAGHPATRMDAQIESMTLSMVEIACGKRSVLIAVGAERGVDELREHLVASFDCHPIAAAEAAVATAVPIGVDDPATLAGWRIATDGDMFAIANATMQVGFYPIPSSPAIDSDSLAKVLPTLFGAAGMTWARDRSVTRDGRLYEFGRISANGDSMPGLLALWACPGRADAVIAMAIGPDATGDAAIDFLGKLRCARPDDPPLSLAPAAP